MEATHLQDNPAVAQKNGVINPYALAEVVSGRRIQWSEVTDVPRLLEDVLNTPYQELFDPKYEGPLYMGLKLNKAKTLERFRSPLLDIHVRTDINDLEIPIE